MLSVRCWPLVLALFVVGCGGRPTATPSGTPDALDRARAHGTTVALTREPIERACRGASGRGPKNCATATVETAHRFAQETASAGGCFRRWDCNLTAEAILTGTPPAR